MALLATNRRMASLETKSGDTVVKRSSVQANQIEFSPVMFLVARDARAPGEARMETAAGFQPSGKLLVASEAVGVGNRFADGMTRSAITDSF